MSATTINTSPKILKDEVLFERSRHWNVAQFASFSPALEPRFQALIGIAPDHRFPSLEEAVTAVFARSGEKSVNVRTFHADNPQTTAFAMGLKSPEAAIAKVREFAAAGLYTIVNETIDINDGGVSGVYHQGRAEFAPGDTPRCVEKPGTCSLPLELARKLLATVYGFTPAFDDPTDMRIEFSLHPMPRGTRDQHMIVWEAGRDVSSVPAPRPTWPNRFSRHIGDKVFGLLVADLCGLPVPATTVISRRLAVFRFGTETGSPVSWMRTCPNEQTPGKFSTTRGWVDIFSLMKEEDPDGKFIGSILCQKEVKAAWSGALITTADGKPVIEGVPGFGDGFMQGTDLPDGIPAEIKADILVLYDQAVEKLGPVRFEWVHDGAKAWVVQLHSGKSLSREDWIVEGTPARWHDFEAAHGLDALRGFVETLDPSVDGIRLHGQIGLTSHMADVIRKAKVPARMMAA